LSNARAETLLKTFAINIDIVIMAVCACAWALAGFPHFAEVVPSIGLAVAVVGGLIWLTWRPKD